MNWQRPPDREGGTVTFDALTGELVTTAAIRRAQADRRLLKRLLHSHHDLWQAQECVNQIVGRNLHAATAPFEKRLLECLNTALIVSYWRPFSKNKGAADVDPDLPDRYRRLFTPVERALHERIRKARKQDQAHSDPAGRSIRITVSELDGVPFATPVGRDPFVPLSRDEICQIDAMITKLLVAIIDEQARIVRTLRPGEHF